VNEYGPLRRVAIRSVADAFRSDEQIAAQWESLNFTARPKFGRALEQYDAFVALLRDAAATITRLPPAAGLTLDAIYVRDASVVAPDGVIRCRMGKPARQAEPEVNGGALEMLGTTVVGGIQAPGQLEGGDVVWFDDRTVAVGRGYRTNDEGIRQLRALLPADVDLIVVPLPHHRGPGDVFHLMSIISPVDHDLAVVFSPLMPVPFREWLCARGMSFVEVPDDEFESMGANVLTIAPRRCVMLEGNPQTRARLEAAGVEVLTYDGSEISVKGGGGPTCLTRPLERD
jgi:N-dimethylarginine dimethylaminohydrolase